MNRTIVLVLTAWACVQAFAQQAAPTRPKITGIDHVAFYTTSPDANRHLYADVLGLASQPPIESGQTQRFLVGFEAARMQWVAYSPAPAPKAADRMDHVAFRTDDCVALRGFLAANGVKVPDSIKHLMDGGLSFRVTDPEGHAIEFVETRPPVMTITGSQVMTDAVSRRIIHAGFIVHDRAAEDHFYKDILGFHLYWQGGMQNDRADWVAMQVPDGTDWVEYMLNIKLDADQQLTGVMNHVSLGVKDIKAAQAKLEARGWKATDREHAQMGRDGKWQLNLYDPDQTRIELMEFTPAEKPCCSEFQGRHPSEPN
jgi:catechol 2,3-dioxygenase-like lactoylglutathione lyase family enzyme